MSDRNWTKFPSLFSLYIAQSIPMSFFSTVVPVIMRQENYSLSSIGLMQLVKLPWILKFLWAPLVDRTSDTTRGLKKWILFSEIFYAAVIILIGTLSLETDFRLIVALMIMAFVASATQDIATDSFAVRILKPEERSLGNSMQGAGSFVGTLFGTGVLLIAYHYFGWDLLLILLACFVLFAIVPMMMSKENADRATSQTQRVSLAHIVTFFRMPGIHKRVILLMLYYSGLIGILAMLKPWLVDLGYNVKEIGFISGIVGTSSAALAALAAGWIIKKAGRKLSLFMFLSLSLLTSALFFILSGATPAREWLFAAVILLWTSYGLSSVVIYTVSMDIVRPGSEGTDFTLQIVITHLSGLIMAVLSGHLADSLGYRGLFAGETVLCLVAFAALIYAFPLKKKKCI